MRLLRRAVFALLVGLAALELVLQGAAFVATRGGGAAVPVPAAGGPAPILCIGDSYTYGLGATATEFGYPGRLQLALRAKLATAPNVVNAGWPGQNSREALLRLDRLLADNQPQLVCVLVGLNDTWTRPEPVAPGELPELEAAGWTWRWRSWRLLQLLLRGVPAELPAAPSVAKEAPVEPGKPTASFAIASQAVALVRAGKQAEAIATLERAIADDPPNAPEYHQGMVQIHTSIGQRERAAASLQWLRAQYRQQPTAPVAEALATSLHAVGEKQQAAELAVAGVQQFPQSSTLWWIASQFHYDTGKLGDAERELDRAIATATPDNREWLASLHRELARACCDRDLEKALRAMLTAMHIDHDVERCRLVVDGAPQAFSHEALARCLQKMAPTGADQELLQRLLGNAWADRTGVCQVLGGHLRQIVQRCRDHGAKVVLLGYPLPVDDLAAVQREVATALQVPYVPCLPTFTAELQHRPRQDLYVRDGHCTDAGYALMANSVLPTVQEQIGR